VTTAVPTAHRSFRRKCPSVPDRTGSTIRRTPVDADGKQHEVIRRRFARRVREDAFDRANPIAEGDRRTRKIRTGRDVDQPGAEVAVAHGCQPPTCRRRPAYRVMRPPRDNDRARGPRRGTSIGSDRCGLKETERRLAGHSAFSASGGKNWRRTRDMSSGGFMVVECQLAADRGGRFHQDADAVHVLSVKLDRRLSPDRGRFRRSTPWRRSR
jgi:hypothetical protein